MVPSERVIVPRSADIAPPDALGFPVVVSGGQPCAHAPEQLDLFLLSAIHRYSVLPFGPTRNVPSELCDVFTMTAVADAFVEAGVELAACLEECELELLLPHAATTSATAITRTALAYNLVLLIIVAPTLSFSRTRKIERVVIRDHAGDEILPEAAYTDP